MQNFLFGTWGFIVWCSIIASGTQPGGPSTASIIHCSISEGGKAPRLSRLR